MDEQRFHTWHQLFDYLCHRAGYGDNAELATRYCLKSGKKGRQEFEAIQKNLRNWRTGRHLPLRRNLTLLAELLGVEDDHELHRTWQALYAVARGEATQEDTESKAIEATEARHVSLFDSAGSVRWLAMSVAVAVGGLFTWKSLAEQIAFERLPMIGYDARVKMVVGETRLIHGDRGDCGGEPPDWYYILPRVPASALGIFSDGGVARKMDNGCNAVIRARAVRFTAKTAGSEEIELLGDYMKIVVTENSYPRIE